MASPINPQTGNGPPDPLKAFAQLEIGPDRLWLLRDGEQVFPAMLEAIAAARASVCVETYMIREDRTGRRFAQALCDRARAGLDVRLMFDAWGSQVSLDLLDELTRAKVRWAALGPLFAESRLRNLMAPLLRRNHRKAVLIDGKIGFFGGLNLTDDYASEGDGGSGWRDTQVRVEGPATADAQRLFDDTWQDLVGLPSARPASPLAAVSKVRVLGNGFGLPKRTIRRAYLAAVDSARLRIRLTSAYFLPPPAMVRALRSAARRGVDIQIIVAGATDQPIVRYAAFRLYGQLAAAGVRIFEWNGRILHAKTATIDGAWPTVGSANLDAMSLSRNLELNVFIDDPPFAGALERMFAADLASCREVEPGDWLRLPWWQKAVAHVAFLLRRWL